MKSSSAIKKYYIGFALLGLATIGITIFVLLQGVSAKQDIQTSKRGNEIADSLNDYISKQRKIPESLDEAGIKDVPGTIKFTKNDDNSYKFCVTYKAAKSYSSPGLTNVLFGAALRESSNYDDNDLYSSSSNYKPSSLYLPYSYKKGENCQTVEPYISSSRYQNYFNDYPIPTTSQSNTSTSLKARDTERQTDIKAMHGQIEAYYAQNGRYPSLADMNSSTFRNTSLKGLDGEALKDPVGKVGTLVGKATKNYYSYAVTSATGGTCDNLTTDCAKYTLTATLEAGGTYTKSNLN